MFQHDETVTRRGWQKSMQRPFTLRDLFVCLVVVSALLALGRCSYLMIEDEQWRTHPDESAVAQRIRHLGGAYNVDKAHDRHIIAVQLDDTSTTDVDLLEVLDLPRLEHLTLQRTRVSDKSLPAIFSHPRLRTIRVRGSLVTQPALRKAIDQNERINVDE